MDMPKKKYEMHNHHTDSTVWDEVKFRPNDIVIASYPKCGTTLTQQMVAQLIFNGDPDVPVAKLSPWVDLRVVPRKEILEGLEAQTNRRLMKTHLPVYALTMSSIAKYIFIGRDGRDAAWSLHNHHFRANDKWYKALNETPGLVGPPMTPANPDVVAYFREWLNRDGYPFFPFWEVVKSWWDIRHLPNVMLMHYEDAIKDKKKTMEQIAKFLEVEVEEDKWQDIIAHCSMDYMRENADKTVPAGGIFWDEGPMTFLFKGVNGRWKGLLTTEDCENYEKMSREQLGEECARWLAEGGSFS